jgi:hypothetical protein
MNPKKRKTKNTRLGGKRRKKGRRFVLQYATIKPCSLTNFKEFAFSANGCFIRKGGNQRAISIVFVIK